MRALAAFLLGVFPAAHRMGGPAPSQCAVAEPTGHGSDIHFALDRRGSKAEHVPVVADHSCQPGSAIRAARQRVSVCAAAVVAPRRLHRLSLLALAPPETNPPPASSRDRVILGKDLFGRVEHGRGSQALAPAGNRTDCVRGWVGGRRRTGICPWKARSHPTVTPEREANSHWPDVRSGSTAGAKDVKEHRVSERELIEICRDQSAKSPYRTKLEIEQYLQCFQFIAAPLLKQQDIMVAQRDLYFISSHSSFNDKDSGSVSEMVTDVLKLTDSWTTPTEMDDNYERYPTGKYDNIEPSFSDTSEVSDSGNITESDSSSVFDSMTEFEAKSLLDEASLEHTNVQQLNAPKFDLEAILELCTFFEPSQLSILPPITCFDPCSEPDSVTDLFLELFNDEKNVSNFSALFPNVEPDLFTIYLFYSEKNSSDLSTAFFSKEKDMQVDYESAVYTEQKFPESHDTPGDNKRNLDLVYELYFDADIPELSHHFTSIYSTFNSEPVSITDMFIKLILSQETSQAINFEIITSANEHDSSSSTHANFDEDLCTIIEFYTE
ncbi:hypothetical protein B0H14DRAFT_2658527 [Mycena olivaceomarginata]|nr:hypothetical protein B0H14DRAFT_2658527 [Mycena olivaceomarginata]